MVDSSKVLLVTGKRAEGLVRKYSSQIDVETEVKVLPISIASFMNLPVFLRELDTMEPEGFSLILVPGLARFNLKKAEGELGVPIFKGPKHAADIPLVLDNLDGLALSKEIPASELLEEEVSKRVRERLRKIKEMEKRELDETSHFEIGKGAGSIFVGPDLPPRIVAEITDAPERPDTEIVEIAHRRVEEGAEILDIGMVPDRRMSEEIPRMISLLRENFDVPLSINTTVKSEIDTAIEHGIDLVVSIDGSTIDDFEGLEIPAVIIPRHPERDHYPLEPMEKVEYMEGLLERAQELGYERPIADPILEPVGRGFMDSLKAFHELRGGRPEVPLFMGIGNVVELYDADSVGITALLLGVASEMDVNLVLSVEASDKTRGNISEVAQARDMMILAEERDSVPKDLGLDLLRLKEKRKLSDPYDYEVEQEAEVVRASSRAGFPRDPKGFFRISVEGSEIIAAFHAVKGSNVVIKGRTAAEMCREIVERELASELSHAAYLGRELQKAEIAIRTGRGYVQEEDIF